MPKYIYVLVSLLAVLAGFIQTGTYSNRLKLFAMTGSMSLLIMVEAFCASDNDYIDGLYILLFWLMSQYLGYKIRKITAKPNEIAAGAMNERDWELLAAFVRETGVPEEVRMSVKQMKAEKLLESQASDELLEKYYIQRDMRIFDQDLLLKHYFTLARKEKAEAAGNK